MKIKKKNPSNKQKLDPDGFIGEFFQNFKDGSVFVFSFSASLHFYCITQCLARKVFNTNQVTEQEWGHSYKCIHKGNLILLLSPEFTEVSFKIR